MSNITTNVRTTTSRKALNDLHYSPNRKDLAGLSPRKSNQLNIKNNLFNTVSSATRNYDSNFKPKELKKRTSISLPDICSQAVNASNSFNRSEASTPNKLNLLKSNTPIKNRRNNISIILEEKENPSLAFSIHLDKSLRDSNLKLEKQSSSEECISSVKKEKKVKYQDSGIQCNKIDEDMLFSDKVDNTPYWKLLAHKRYKCLIDTELENSELSKILDELNEKNEVLRNKNESLNKLLIEYDEIRKMMLESTQNDEEVEDSGYDVSQTN